MGVYSRFTYNHKKLIAAKMSFNRRMDKQTVEQPYNDVLYNNKKKWAINPLKDMDGSSMYIAKSGANL